MTTAHLIASAALALMMSATCSPVLADCDALADFHDLRPRRGPRLVKIPSDALGATRRVIVDSTTGVGAERRVSTGVTIVRLEPRISLLDAKANGGVLEFSIEGPLFPMHSRNDLTRNPTAEETFDLPDGRGSFATFRLPYMSPEYQHEKRYFVVDETGTICRRYLEDDTWTVVKRGIRESSVPSVQLARREKRLPQQVLALAKIGTTIDVEWREVTADGNSQLKSKRSLDRNMRTAITIGPFQFEIKAVDTDAITVNELPAKTSGW